jgi:NAD(P)-dependent dehydrogenase (short-subunit alcohol dehydrogenase family)
MASKWTADDLPDMTGRTVVITGAGSGLGLITARELARVGARVIAAVRDEAATRAATKDIARIEVRHVDVSDLTSIQAFVRHWSGPLDVLINNAGVMDIPARRTADGFDLQTATNYIGPFILTNLLLASINDRVVSVTSQLHRQAQLDIADLDWRTRRYNSMRAYSDSKLALILFSFELQRRLKEAGSPIRSILAHPGIARTGLAAHSRANLINSLSFLVNDAERGALPILFAATQDIPGNSYVGPDGFGALSGYPKVGKPSAAGLDASNAAELWEATVRLTRIDAPLGRPLASKAEVISRS